MAKADRKIIDKVFILLGIVTIVILLVVGALSWKAYSFATNSVKTELAAQKVFFPPANSKAIKELPVSDQEQMDRYAGQQLLTGPQAKVYADNFISFHLSKIANGKTYSQVSSEAQADPTNPTLKAQEQTLFQGETLRGLLLGDGYAYWTFGQIAQYAAITSFVGAAIMALLVLLGLRHLNKS